MKFQKKYIFVITICILSIFICSQLWSFIKFPTNRYDIIGEYSLNNYSPLNDVIKYLIFIFIICLFLFLISRYYFSDANKKNSYRSLKNIDEKINTYVEKLPVLEDDTKNIIEYVEQSNNKKKKFNFWKLLETNE